MLLLILLILALLLFAGFGLAVHVLWWIALAVLIVILVSALTGRF